MRIQRSIAGGSTEDNFASGNANGSRPRGSFWTSTMTNGYESVRSFFITDKSHNTTSAITYKLQLIAHGNHTVYFNYHPNHGNGGNGYQSVGYSNIIAQELGHTITDG